MIYHDWTPKKCRFLTGKSFESLGPGGHILIHEMLYNDEKTGPFPVAAFSMIMLGWTEGEQYSGKEISEMLSEAGFGNIQVRPTFGYWGIVTAQKLGGDSMSTVNSHLKVYGIENLRIADGSIMPRTGPDN
jgi:hypothetical protein